MPVLGADVEQLDALERTFTTTAQVMTNAVTSIGGVVQASWWDGPDADGFRTAWSGEHAQRLRRVAAVLTALGSEVKRQAAEQRAASQGTGSNPAPLAVAAPLAQSYPGGWDDPNHGGDADLDGIPDVVEDLFPWAATPSTPNLIHTNEGEGWTPPGSTTPGGGWIPQASAIDELRGEFLSTYYQQQGNSDEDNPPDLPGVLLSIQDRDTGSETKNVLLTDVGGIGGPPHGGGISIHDDYVYVAGGGSIWVYKRSDIDAADSGDAVEPVHVYENQPGTSYLTVDGDFLYAGKYVQTGNDEGIDHGDLFRYEFGPDGTLVSPDGVPIPDRLDDFVGPRVPAGPEHVTETPTSAQGVAVLENGFLFSQSHGAPSGPDDTDNNSDLLFQPFGTTANYDVGDLPPLSQSLIISGDQLFVPTEGGSDQYGGYVPNHIHEFDLVDFGIVGTPDGPAGTIPPFFRPWP